MTMEKTIYHALLWKDIGNELEKQYMSANEAFHL